MRIVKIDNQRHGFGSRSLFTFSNGFLLEWGLFINTYPISCSTGSYPESNLGPRIPRFKTFVLWSHRRASKGTGEIVMTNSITAGARVHITAEYLSEDEPLELLRFQYVNRSRNRISAAAEDRHIRIPTLSGIKSQKGQADRIHLAKPCKIIGQKSDKAKCKSLKQQLLNCEGKVLQNINSPVRSRPAPPTISLFPTCISVRSRLPEPALRSLLGNTLR